MTALPDEGRHSGVLTKYVTLPCYVIDPAEPGLMTTTPRTGKNDADEPLLILDHRCQQCGAMPMPHKGWVIIPLNNGTSHL